jgi:hypothetical protein
VLWLLFACDSLAPTWIDQRPACGAEPYAWSDDLVTWVAAGDGDGGFSIDPAGDARTGLAGLYDPASGEFAYTIEYADGYWLAGASVDDGFGTAWHNGDLDVEYTVAYTDVLGETWSRGARVIREGCKQTWYDWNPELAEPDYQRFDGAWTPGEFRWEADVEDVEWSGVWSEDGTRTVDYQGGGETDTIVDHPDGTRERSFSISGSDYDYDGDETVAFDGGVTRNYRISSGGERVCTVDEDFDYAGNGTAHYECGDDSYDCEYDVKDTGRCLYVCDNGDRGSC